MYALDPVPSHILAERARTSSQHLLGLGELTLVGVQEP